MNSTNFLWSGFKKRGSFTSKVTEWGKADEPIVRQAYVQNKMHRKTYCDRDRIVFKLWCRCHELGSTDIRCPWTHADKSVKEYACSEDRSKTMRSC